MVSNMTPQTVTPEQIAEIRKRHEELVIMYGGEPWDDSCIEDGEQAHMDRNTLLLRIEALEKTQRTPTHEEIKAMWPSISQEAKNLGSTLAACESLIGTECTRCVYLIHTALIAAKNEGKREGLELAAQFHESEWPTDIKNNFYANACESIKARKAWYAKAMRRLKVTEAQGRK